MVNFDYCISMKVNSEAENIASEVLTKIKYSPEVAMEIGNLLIEYAERDVAEALTELNKPIELEIGKRYLNGMGEVREIVRVFEDNPYVFQDHLGWTYTEDGVYDENDTYYDNIRYDLHRETDSKPTPYDAKKHL